MGGKGQKLKFFLNELEIFQMWLQAFVPERDASRQGSGVVASLRATASFIYILFALEIIWRASLRVAPGAW